MNNFKLIIFQAVALDKWAHGHSNDISLILVHTCS